MEDQMRDQVPQLYPQDPDVIDRPFLGGALRRPDPPMVLRYVRGEWEIDVGRLSACRPVPERFGWRCPAPRR
jgi:hypothetical protein